MKGFSALLMIVAALAGPVGASAGIVAKDVDYKEGETVLQGYLAYDDSLSGKLPAVLIVHEWNGLGSYIKGRAQQIAKLGYVAFAVDIYGKGVRATAGQDPSKLAEIYYKDRPLMRRRSLAGLGQVKTYPFVDPARIAVMGYCFGGGVALDLAGSGENLIGVVTFHGALQTLRPEDAKNIKGKVLALHGAEDPAVPQDVVLAFEKMLRDAGTDWELDLYSHAVHGFTDRDNGNDPSKTVAYNPEADARSFERMTAFFKEIFATK